MLSAVFGVLLVVGVLGLLGLLGITVLAAKRDVAALESRIATGDISGLTELSPGALAGLSKDVVGRAYRSSKDGSRTSKLALTVPAYEEPGTLLALTAESTPDQERARIDILACGPRMSLALRGGIWDVQVDRQPFGTIDPGTGSLDDAERGNVGFYRRTSQGVHVRVQGMDVAWIDSDAKLHSRRPESLRPLLRLASPSPDPDAALWALAIVAVELTSALMVIHTG